MGFRELVSYDVLGITFPANTVTTLRTTTSKRPDLIDNFLKTLIEGIYIFKTNKPKSLAVMKKHLLGASDEVLEETYRYTSNESLQKIIDQVRFHAKSRRWRFAWTCKRREFVMPV